MILVQARIGRFAAVVALAALGLTQAPAAAPQDQAAPAAPPPQAPDQAAPAPPPDQAQPQPTFRGGIDFVSVDVIVTDGKEAPVLVLTQADFEITEDG
jgi:hypothetical protein